MRYFIAILFLVLSNSCGSAKSSSRRADIIPSPKSGYSCFIVVDDDDKPVGGNCVKD